MMRGVAYPAETRPLTRRRRCQWPSPPRGGPRWLRGHVVTTGRGSDRQAACRAGWRPHASASPRRWRDMTGADHGSRGSPADRQSAIPQRAGRPQAPCRPRVTGIATLKRPRVNHDTSQRAPRPARPRVTGGPTCGRHGPLTDADGRLHAPSATVKSACRAGQAGARPQEHLP